MLGKIKLIKRLINVDFLFLFMRNLRKDALNVVVSFVVMLIVWGIYVWINEPFPTIFFPVIFLLLLIFLEVSDLSKK